MTKKKISTIAAVAGGFLGGETMTLIRPSMNVSFPLRMLLAGAAGGISALAVGKVLAMVSGSEPKDGD